MKYMRLRAELAAPGLKSSYWSSVNVCWTILFLPMRWCLSLFHVSFVWIIPSSMMGLHFLPLLKYQEKTDVIEKYTWRKYSCEHNVTLLVAFYTYVIKFTYEPPLGKTNKMDVRPAKTQISLGIRPVWSESSLSAWRKLGSLATHWEHSKDSDQTGRMPRLVWVFAERTFILLVLSWGGSYM